MCKTHVIYIDAEAGSIKQAPEAKVLAKHTSWRLSLPFMSGSQANMILLDTERLYYTHVLTPSATPLEFAIYFEEHQPPQLLSRWKEFILSPIPVDIRSMFSFPQFENDYLAAFDTWLQQKRISGGK